MTHSVRSGTENIRNIAILGHAGAGKTTLVEALLAKAGAIPSPGSVEKGSTVCDFTDQEKRLRHSLDVAVCHLQNAERSINLLDTPGYPDFMGRALAVLPAVETAAIVINAESGIELVAQRMMAFAAERKLCRLIVVNKIDAAEADLAGIFREIRENVRARVLALESARAGRAKPSPTASSSLRARRRIFPPSRPRTRRCSTKSSSSTTTSWSYTSSRARTSRSSSCTIRSSGRCAPAI